MIMKKCIFRILPLIFILLLTLLVSTGFAKDIHPGGPFVQENQHVSYSAIMTFEEVEDELFKLEQRSKDLLQVDIAGFTLEGRPLYIAKIGWGPRKCGSKAAFTATSPMATTSAWSF